MKNLSENKDEIRWKILKFKLLEDRIGELFRVFRAVGIEPILFKGWVAGLYYPQQYERVFSDVDLAVSPADYEKAQNLIKELNLTVDLHRGFYKFGVEDWKELFENSLIKTVSGIEFRILCSEDHLKILCIHWLMDGGIHQEKLKDIYYLVENAEIDWAKVFENLSEKRKRWVVLTIALVNKYYGLPTEKIPFREIEIFEIPAWVIKTLEKEWRNPLLLRPLQTCLKEPKMLLRQILKRIPPNSIQATVETEGDFDESSRLKYQLKNTFERFRPSVKRIYKTLLTGKKY